jgi:hypothetical protein
MLLIWTIDATDGFDTALATIERGRLHARGRSAGLLPVPFWSAYTLETADDYVTSRLTVETDWDGGSASLDLRRVAGGWLVNGEPRPDLDSALDCDLAACPLTNTMPIVRHGLHRGPGQAEFVMAFVELPRPRPEARPRREVAGPRPRLRTGGGAGTPVAVKTPTRWQHRAVGPEAGAR